MAGIFDDLLNFIQPTDFMNPQRATTPQRRPTPQQQAGVDFMNMPAPGLQEVIGNGDARGGLPPAPAPARGGEGPIPAPPRETQGQPAVSPGQPAVSPAPVPGPVVNNAGITSNAAGPLDLAAIGASSPLGQQLENGAYVGPMSTPDDRGLLALGYYQNANGNLRRAGSPYDQQLNLMTQLQRSLESQAPVVTEANSWFREPQERARDAYRQQMAGIMGQFGNSIMPNQLAQEGQRLEQRAREGYMGPNNQWVPGSMAISAQNAIGNTPAGLDAIRRQAIRIAMTNQGIPQSQIDEELRTLPGLNQGGGLMNYLGGPGGGTGAGGGTGVEAGNVRPNPFTGAPPPNTPPTEGAPPSGTPPAMSDRVRSVVDRARQNFQGPAGPNGRRPAPVVPPYTGNNIQPLNNAITNYFAEFTPQEMQNNYNEIATAAVHTFGQQAMNGWQGQSPWFSTGTFGQQRDRVTDAQGAPRIRGLVPQFGQNFADILNLPIAPLQSGSYSWDARLRRLGWQ